MAASSWPGVHGFICRLENGAPRTRPADSNWQRIWNDLAERAWKEVERREGGDASSTSAPLISPCSFGSSLWRLHLPYLPRLLPGAATSWRPGNAGVPDMPSRSAISAKDHPS